MKHAIDPTIDCVFKAILGSNEHINLLLIFLNSICKADLSFPICDLTILNPYNEKQFRHRSKLSHLLYIFCRLDKRSVIRHLMTVPDYAALIQPTRYQ